YQEVNPPLLVKDEAMFGTGQLPKFEEDLFKIDFTDASELNAIAEEFRDRVMKETWETVSAEFQKEIDILGDAVNPTEFFRGFSEARAKQAIAPYMPAFKAEVLARAE